MTAKELEERLKKAEEKVAKKESTIERHKKQAEKKMQIIIKNGYEKGLEDDSCYRGDNYNYEALDALSDYEWKLEDIKGAERALKEAQIVAENWKAKLDKQKKLENTIAFEMPEVFRELQEALATEWTEYDLSRKAQMLKARKKLSFEEFRKIYKYSEEEELNNNKAWFLKRNKRDAELFIIDLYNRVKNITGEVKSWENVYYGGKALNGIVEGENGKAEVRTIGAGGYNIQRYHLRVLVKEI